MQTEAQLSAILWLDGERQRQLIAAAEEGFKSEVAWLLTSLEDGGLCTLTELSEFSCYFQFRDMLTTAWWSAEECVWSSRPPLRRQNTTDGSGLLIMGRDLECFEYKEMHPTIR